MALVFYKRLTGLVQRTVLDDNLTDDELALVHLPEKDEVILRVRVTLDTFDLAEIQRLVDETR